MSIAAPESDDRVWWRPFADIGSASVSFVDLGPDPCRENAAVARLDSSEKARRRRLLNAGPRREFALCRAALRDILCSGLGCENHQLSFDVCANGKPVALVAGTRAAVHFNVSHSGPYGLIAVVPKGQVGIDVEDRDARRDLDGIASLTFSPKERAELAAAEGIPRSDLFYRIWTMKEALTKAIGVGLTTDVTRFEIPRAMRSGTRRCVFQFPDRPDERWRLENLENADFAAAIATEIIKEEPAP